MNEFTGVEVIAIFEKGRAPKPVRFRFAENGEESIVVNVDRIAEVDLLQSKNDSIYVYKCESVLDNILCRYELEFRQLGGDWQVRIH